MNFANQILSYAETSDLYGLESKNIFTTRCVGGTSEGLRGEKEKQINDGEEDENKNLFF